MFKSKKDTFMLTLLMISDCSIFSFRCFKTGDCIHKFKECDGNINCLNGEDEENCEGLYQSVTGRVAVLMSMLRRNVKVCIRV